MTANLQMPRWACAAVILFSATTILAQCLVDIYQGTSSAPFLSPEWMLQGYTMMLPTFGAVAFALFTGWLFNIGHKLLAVIIFLLATCFMVFTTANGWDFMANQTVARTAAAQERARVAREVAEIQNKQSTVERTQMTEELWRTYTTTTSLDKKNQVLAQIKDATKATLELQTVPVEVQQIGSGGIFHRSLGWRPEAIQEAKALALPALLMVAKMLGLTLGFGFWPRGGLKALGPQGVLGKFSDEKTQQKAYSAHVSVKVSKRAAFNELKAMLAVGGKIESQASLARKWGVSAPTVHIWLKEWGVTRETSTTAFGRRNAITSLNGAHGRAQ